jgi:hypothetical protein
MTPRDKLIALITDWLVSTLGVDEDRAHSAATAFTIFWKIKRETRIMRDDKGMFDGGNMMRDTVGQIVRGEQLSIMTPWQPETAEERLLREAREEAVRWVILSRPTLEEADLTLPGPCPENAPDPGPPPVRVGQLAMLQQRIWWRKSTKPFKDTDTYVETVPIRIDDMDHNHRMNLLAYLWRRKDEFKTAYEIQALNLISSPLGPRGDMARDAADHEMDRLYRESVDKWFTRQPLIRELTYRTTPWGFAPLTWRPMDEAPRGGKFDPEVIVVRYRMRSETIVVGEDGEATPIDGLEDAVVAYDWVLHEWRVLPSNDKLPYTLVSTPHGEEYQIVDPIVWREATDTERDAALARSIDDDDDDDGRGDSEEPR